MNANEILKGNKLIAKFMQLEKKIVAKGLIEYMYTHKFTQHGFYETTHEFCLLFHSSWDWLIPVVEKIEATNRINDNEWYPYQVTIWNTSCIISDGNNANKIVHTVTENNKIEATWSAVVKFIKWYNNENKQK